MRQWKRLVNPERLSGYRFRLRVFKPLEELAPELKELVEDRQTYHPRRTIVGTLSDVKPLWTVFAQSRYRPHLEAQRKPGQPWFACDWRTGDRYDGHWCLLRLNNNLRSYLANPDLPFPLIGLN